ncbi:MAG: glycoside hydrolase, partial [Bacteroidia bacterium]|nr:glycoside hydrolase [Bacteroidia bacterium]
MKRLLESAKKILDLNWRNGFTIPTDKLYPFQWNWDSGFVSLGHGHFDLSRAIKEIDSLLSGQWENGMIPHIIFHSENENSYFPNHDFWGANVNKGAPKKPKTSGITQPPVIGFIIEELYKMHPNDKELADFIKLAFPKILHYHRFFYTYRDPNQEALAFIYHPWESGRDNSPLWDESVNRIDLSKVSIPPYNRKDKEHA